jgi:biotin carboxylase
MARLLMVGCGRMGRPYLRRAHMRGLAVAVLDAPDALAGAQTRAALGAQDRAYPVAGQHDDAWLTAASAALRDGPVAGVIAFSEPHVLTAALLADELKLPGPGLRAAVTSRNKIIQRELFARAGLAQPGYYLAQGADAALAWAAGRFPVVAKPLSGMGSIGVQIVASGSELRRWCLENESGNPFLVEQYLTGPEYSVEAIAERGSVVFWSVTEKTTTSGPFCVELAHHVPADCDPGTRKAISELLAGVIAALGMGSGIVHLELRLEPGGPHVMEVAVRTPGDFIMDVVQAATGVDLYDAVVAVACGQAPCVDVPAGRAACAWYPLVGPGVVTAIEGVEKTSQLDGVMDVEIRVRVGAAVNPYHSSMDRVGVVVVQAKDRAELDSRLDAIQSQLRIRVQPAALTADGR